MKNQKVTTNPFSKTLYLNQTPTQKTLTKNQPFKEDSCFTFSDQFIASHSLTFIRITVPYATMSSTIVSLLKPKPEIFTPSSHSYQETRGGGNDRDRDHDLDLFIKQYREYYADIETKWECLETQIKILEKKLKLDVMFIDLKLMDGGKTDVMMLLLEGITSERRYFRRQMMVLLADKTAYEFRFLGLKGLISNDVGSFDFAYDARVLHRLNVENYNEHLRRKLSRDGINRLNSATSSGLLFFHELSRPSK